METALLQIFWEYDFVTYYTVKLEDNSEIYNLSETDKFYQKFNNKEDSHYQEYKTIVRIIDAIGNHKKGAESCLFRFEDAANALPPKRKEAQKVLEIGVEEHPTLRLYCIRLPNEVVILLNGGIKTKDKALNCPNIKPFFKFAPRVAKEIDKRISDREIKIEGKNIVNNTNEQEIILYL